MKESKRNTTVLIIITIAVFLVAVLGATFAYFATERNVGAALNANVQTASSMYSFSAKSNGTIEMDIKFNQMSEANISTEKVATDNATIEVNLASPSDGMYTKCTYDIVWVWDSSDMYTKADVDTLPYKHTDNKIYNYEFSTTINGENETDLSTQSRTDKKVTIQKGVSIAATGTTPVVKKYDIAAYIYNLPVKQTELFGKTFKAHITIDSLNCSMSDIIPIETTAEEGSLAYYINSVYNSKSNRTNIKNGAAGLYFHDANLTNGANDNTYRYAGATADVNNYACFLGDDCSDENNLYRIISVDSNTNLTKVIKEKTIFESRTYWNSKGGYIAKDTDVGLASGTAYNNLWAYPNGDGTYYTSSLNDYLNGTYLTSLGDKASKIEMTTWSVGGASYNDDLTKKNVKSFMDVELNNSITYEAKIGLVYASEYGFSALPEYWTNILATNASNGYNGAKLWIPNGDYPWTISRNIDTINQAFNIGHASGPRWYPTVTVSEIYSRTSTGGAFPTFNLSPDVKITNADSPNVGSKANPMIIV